MKLRLEIGLLPFWLLLAILPFIGTVALRLLCLTIAFVYAMYVWRRAPLPALPAKPALVVWALVALVSLGYAVDPVYSLGEIKNEMGYTMMAFFSFFIVTGDDRRLKGMLLAVSAGALVLCVWALAARFQLGLWNDSGRYGGTGAFATYLVAMVPVVALLGFYFDDARLRRLALVLLVLLMVTGFYCQQRIIWPVLFAQAAVALLLYRKDLGLSVARVVGVLALLVVAASLTLAVTQATRFKDGSASSDAMNNDSRLMFWPEVAAKIASQPLSGAGFGRRAMHNAYRDLIPRDNSLLWHAHNVVLNYGLAMGVPGMLALLLVFAALLREYGRFWCAGDRHLRMLGACGIVLVIGVFFRNMVNDFFLRDAALLFWALNGTLLGIGSRKLTTMPGTGT